MYGLEFRRWLGSSHGLLFRHGLWFSRGLERGHALESIDGLEFMQGQSFRRPIEPRRELDFDAMWMYRIGLGRMYAFEFMHGLGCWRGLACRHRLEVQV